MLLSSELQLSPTLEQALRVRHFWLLQQLLLRICSLQKETLLAKMLHHAVCSSIPHLSHLTHTDTHTHTHIHKLTHTHSCWAPSLCSMIMKISFSVAFWDTLRTCVQTILPILVSSFHLFSCVRLCATPGTTAHQDSLSITKSQS